MKTFLFLLLLTLTYRDVPDGVGEQADDYRLASPAYLVLAQKALTYQFDGDTAGWSGLLADTLDYIPPEGSLGRQPKAAAVAHWQAWWHRTGVVSTRLSAFTHRPIESNRPLARWNQSGVCMVSSCVAELRLTTGRHRLLRLTMCCHFDVRRQIDGYRLSWQTLQNPVGYRSD